MVGIAQLVRASGCGPEGRGFESHYSPHSKKHFERSAFFIHSKDWYIITIMGKRISVGV